MYKNILNKILLSKKPSEEICKLIETREIDEIIPELLALRGFDQKTPYHDKDVFEHTMAVLDAVKPTLVLRMAALLHDIKKPECFTVDENGIGHFYGHHIKSAEESEKILKRLGYDEDFIEDVKILIRYHYIKAKNLKERGISTYVDPVGLDRIDDLLELVRADKAGKPDNVDEDVVEKLRELIIVYLRNGED